MEEVTQDVKQENTVTQQVNNETVEQDVKQVEQVPYSRLSKEIAEKKALQEKLAQYEADQEKTRQKELERKGEYETITKEITAKYETAKRKAEEYDRYIANRRSAILESLDEEERDILSDLSLEKLEKYQANKTEKTKIAVENTRGGTSINPPKSFFDMSDDEKKDPDTWKRYVQSFRRK